MPGRATIARATHRWAAATKGTNSTTATATTTLSGGGIDNQGRKQQR